MLESNIAPVIDQAAPVIDHLFFSVKIKIHKLIKSHLLKDLCTSDTKLRRNILKANYTQTIED